MAGAAIAVSLTAIRLGAVSLAVVSLAVVSLPACGGPAGAHRREPPARVRVAVSLRFEEAPSQGSTPRTAVSLRVIAEGRSPRTVALGTYDGACTPRPVADAGDSGAGETTEQSAEPGGVVLRARCWWGKSSASIEVRRTDGALVATLARSAFGERRGDAGEPRPGVLGRVDLPAGAVLDPIRPDGAWAP
jgi:hypothetical protein